MAESKNNIITHGLSGKVGDLIVFRNRNGKTFVSNKPKERTRELTESQKLNLRHFQEAIIYGKSAIADPSTKESYAASAKNGLTAYNVAVADFMHAPDIEKVDLSKYTGKVGDTITVKAIDDFMVKEVSVTILNSDGSQVESGLAQLSANGLDWVFTATVENTTIEGDKIIIRASDIPGNISEKTENL